MRLFFLAIPLLAVLACAQTQTPGPAPAPGLVNSGKPMRVPFQCGPEDIHAFGLTCPWEQPCPVYLELAAVEGAGNRLFAVGNIHSDAATFSSVLLASDDAGATWREPFLRARSVGLDQIEFFDFETGWISGQTLGAVPRDPFLLVTSDGGKTWRSRPISNEPRIGAIEAFRFDSKTHGMLWIDRTQAGETGNRYEEYESETGGESWMLRQVSDRPIRRKPSSPAPAKTWRIHPDSASKAFRIERQSGERWLPVASFLVTAGNCREPEVVIPEPAPEPPTAEPETR